MLSPKEIAYAVTKALDEKKGMDIKLLKIDKISSLADYMEEATAEEYGQLMIELNEMDCELTRKDDVWTFVYEADVDGTSYTYLSAVYASETHFWTVQAYCATSDYAKNYDTMWAMLKSVIV